MNALNVCRVPFFGCDEACILQECCGDTHEIKYFTPPLRVFLDFPYLRRY